MKSATPIVQIKKMAQGDKKTGNPKDNHVFAVLAASGQIKIFRIVANEHSVRMQELKELAKDLTPSGEQVASPSALGGTYLQLSPLASLPNGAIICPKRQGQQHAIQMWNVNKNQIDKNASCAGCTGACTIF